MSEEHEASPCARPGWGAEDVGWPCPQGAPSLKGEMDMKTDGDTRQFGDCDREMWAPRGGWGTLRGREDEVLNRRRTFRLTLVRKGNFRE